MSKYFHRQKIALSTSIACVTDETKPLEKSIYEPAPKSLFWAPPLSQDLSTFHDWLVKKPLSICRFSKIPLWNNYALHVAHEKWIMLVITPSGSHKSKNLV